ncbi:MAG: HDOD domain-containing protein [Planctomycetota bacterium]
MVDGRPLVRELLSAVLESSGYLVFSAEDVEEASELVAGVAPCLLVAGCGTDPDPELNGIAALVEGQDPTPPALLLHDASHTEAVERLLGTAIGAAVPEETFERKDFLASCLTLAPVSAAPVSQAPEPSDRVKPAAGASAMDRVPKPAAHSSPPATKSASPIGPAAQIDEVGLLKTLQPVVSRDQVDEAIDRAVTLPLDAKIAAHVAKIIANETTSPAELCRAVARDAALTLRVMAVAAAANNGQREPIGSLARAIDQIGKAGIAMILSKAQEAGPIAETNERLDQALQRCNLNRRATWCHAHAVALIAGEIARLTGGTAEYVQSARTAGWLHDLGRQILAFTMTDAYAEACEAAVALGLPLAAVENQMMLDHHGQVMEKILRGLKLNPAIGTAVGCHHLPLIEARNLSGRHFQETITLAIADRYASALGTGDPIADPLRGLEHHLTSLKLEPQKLSASLEACQKQLQQDVGSFGELVAEAMPTDSPWLATLDAQVRQKLGTLFVGSDRQNDAFAVLAQKLNVRSDIQPNLAVVRLTNVRDRDPLSGMLRAWEFEHGVSRLPLLIISPKGNLTLEDGLMNGRDTQCLAEPVLPRELSGALNALLPSDDQQEAAQAA